MDRVVLRAEGGGRRRRRLRSLGLGRGRDVERRLHAVLLLLLGLGHRVGEGADADGHLAARARRAGLAVLAAQAAVVRRRLARRGELARRDGRGARRGGARAATALRQAHAAAERELGRHCAARVSGSETRWSERRRGRRSGAAGRATERKSRRRRRGKRSGSRDGGLTVAGGAASLARVVVVGAGGAGEQQGEYTLHDAVTTNGGKK